MSSNIEMVDTVERVEELSAQWLKHALPSGSTPSALVEAASTFDRAQSTVLSIDLEGRDLSATGTVYLVSVHCNLTPDIVFLIDIVTLGTAAFIGTAAGSAPRLKAVLEHTGIPVLMFDCRNDSAALYHHQHKVHPTCVIDVQVPAVRRFVRGDFLIGMKKSFERLGLLTFEEQRAKETGVRLFAPELGGSYEVWAMRPMSRELQIYAAVDTKYLMKALRQLTSGTGAMEAMTVGARRVEKQIAHPQDSRTPHRDF